MGNCGGVNNSIAKSVPEALVNALRVEEANKAVCGKEFCKRADEACLAQSRCNSDVSPRQNP